MTEITKDIRYIGVNDHDIDLFEGMYDVPNGMAYNSYVILDEKIAVLDTVDQHFGEEWLTHLKAALNGRTPDYLIIHHMEPDHSANIAKFLAEYPDAEIVGNAKTFGMLGLFFPGLEVSKKLTVTNGQTLCLGKHTLKFIFAPMVHWPEVMMSYEETDKVLFSADAFGKFGALDADEDWACEARRYYFGIVGKYGQQVQAVLKQTAALAIQIICPLHGPVLCENLSYYLDLYQTWSSYGVESEGIMIAYTSVYGNTKAAAALLAETLREKGCPKVVFCDLAREDMAEAVEDAFRYGTLVLATTTYNADIFPFMRTFIQSLTERSYQNRRIAFIENGAWAPTAGRVMEGMFEKSKNITMLGKVTIKAAMTDENRTQIAALADTLMA